MHARVRVVTQNVFKPASDLVLDLIGFALSAARALDIRWVALLIYGMTRFFVDKHFNMLEEGRRVTEHWRWFSKTKYLYSELIRYLKEHPELQTQIERPI